MGDEKKNWEIKKLSGEYKAIQNRQYDSTVMIIYNLSVMEAIQIISKNWQ